MNFNFELFLVIAVFITGLISLIDIIWWSSKRQLAASKLEQIKKDGRHNEQIAHLAAMPIWIEYSRSFFPILFLVLILRSFIVEPFRIPSGSLEPSLLVGDFVVTNKFSYGVRLPVIRTKILNVGEPKTGDIVVFRWPIDQRQDFIKRVIGVPGDKISYLNKVLYINGVPAAQEFQFSTQDDDDQGNSWPVNQSQENLAGIKHSIFLRPDAPPQDFTVIVPANVYFVMGDNRDSSNDSRYWGFVPENNLTGKAFAIWMSWDNHNHTIRWKRIGKRII